MVFTLEGNRPAQHSKISQVLSPTRRHVMRASLKKDGGDIYFSPALSRTKRRK